MNMPYSLIVAQVEGPKHYYISSKPWRPFNARGKRGISPPRLTQEAMFLQKLLLLPHLLTKQMKGEEPLIDYKMSHVVNFEKYLNIMWSKSMAKSTTNAIKECKWKEKKERRSKKEVETLTIAKHATQKSIEKQARAIFMQAWSLIAIKDTRDQFHNNFVVRLWVSSLGYWCVNLVATTKTQRATRARVKAKMQVVRDVLVNRKTISIK
jgi:hypothetical protein